jgi:superkiller protein 3
VINYEENIDRKQGIFMIKESLKKNPNYVTAWNKLGKIMDQQGNLELSKKFYVKALQIESDNFMSILGLSNYYFRIGEYENCEKEIQTITTPQYANDIRTLKLRADNFYQMGLYKEALQLYQKCKKVDTGSKVDILIGIGNCYFKMDEYKNAVETFGIVKLSLLQTTDRNIPVRINLASSLLMFNKYDDAIEEFNECLKLDPERTEIYLYIANVYVQKEDFETATKYISDFIKKNPDNYQGHLSLAELYNTLGAHQSALEEIEVRSS